MYRQIFVQSCRVLLTDKREKGSDPGKAPTFGSKIAFPKNQEILLKEGINLQNGGCRRLQAQTTRLRAHPGRCSHRASVHSVVNGFAMRGRSRGGTNPSLVSICTQPGNIQPDMSDQEGRHGGVRVV